MELLQGKLGMLLLSLCYQPADNTITINIIKARDLKAKDINGLSGAQDSVCTRRAYNARLIYTVSLNTGYAIVFFMSSTSTDCF